MTEHEDWFDCSSCGEGIKVYSDVELTKVTFKTCPHCGVKNHWAYRNGNGGVY